MHRITKAAYATALCSLALPAVAGAATKTVSAGPPLKKPPAGVPKDAGANAFFPRTVTVHQGDTLKFEIAGFHAVNFVKKGEAAPGLAVPAGSNVAGVNDAAGQPFWFNGQPQLMLNPSLVAGTKSGGTFTGTEDAASGAPLSEGAPKPWKVKLTKKGSFTFVCPIHPGMSGKVKVVAKSARIPSARADRARVAKQLAKALATLKKLDKSKPPAGDVVTAGPDRKSGEALMRFTPANKTVKAGTAVTFEMSPGSTETHTFTFAKTAKDLEEIAKVFIAPLPSSPKDGPPLLGLDPRVVYPSDVPLPAYDGAQHGNGFLSTGALDGSPATPLPQKATITFAKAGTYQYICLIHSEMHGKITVTS